MRRTTAHGATASLIARAQSVIAEQAHKQEFSVVDLCQMLGISKSHLHRVFRETGTTPARLLRETRIALAEDSLGSATPTPQELRAAAASSGFRNMRMFRRALAEGPVAPTARRSPGLRSQNLSALSSSIECSRQLSPIAMRTTQRTPGLFEDQGFACCVYIASD